MLDTLLEERGAQWWTDFYLNKNRKCPFFTKNPNEDIVEIFENKILPPNATALELGCGNGRNSVYLSLKGISIEGLDFSDSSLKIAREHALQSNANAIFHQTSIFDFTYKNCFYDFIYDCGCFHHIPPHRRPDYIDIVKNGLKPHALFSLVCFAPGGGSDYSDIDVYKNRSMAGGLSFTEDSLQSIFKESFYDIQIRRMKELPEESGMFGKDFIWVVRMRNKEL